MAFIDEIEVFIKAGNGGGGIVAWRHEKGKEFAGPGGGDGGAGGDVYVHAVRNIGLLFKYRSVKEFAAGDGKKGMNWSKHGSKGADLTIDLPIGSILTNKTTGKQIELLKDDETVFLLKGGNGGFGNEHFKGSTNQRPTESTPGKPGEEAVFSIELQLVVDAGLIGLPNAGKSSLLNALTNADAKVGSYQFTTLEPNLGEFHGYILADIPGLIEGASEGKGLGHKFLRHIKRTKILFHCISLENEDLISVYKTIRAELTNFDETLAEKKEVIILTKTDTVTPVGLAEKKKKLAKLQKNILEVSILDDDSVKKLGKDLSVILKKEE